MFFVLALLLIAIINNFLHVINISVFYAFFTEAVQVFFGRGSDWYDVYADVSGVFVALMIVYFRGYFRRVRVG